MGKLALAALLALTACQGADCITLGRPTLHFAAVDAATSVQVPFSGAVLVVTVDGARDSVNTSQPQTANDYWRFIDTGPAQIHFAQSGYAAWDTSFVITTSGFCHVPDLATVVARLRRP